LKSEEKMADSQEEQSSPPASNSSVASSVPNSSASTLAPIPHQEPERRIKKLDEEVINRIAAGEASFSTSSSCFLLISGSFILSILHFPPNLL
jgi:hypothetical protein